MDFPDFRQLGIEPAVTRRQCGGWLAVAPNWAPLHIGVTGATEREVRDRFREAVTAWSITLEAV